MTIRTIRTARTARTVRTVRTIRTVRTMRTVCTHRPRPVVIPRPGDTTDNERTTTMFNNDAFDARRRRRTTTLGLVAASLLTLAACGTEPIDGDDGGGTATGATVPAATVDDTSAPANDDTAATTEPATTEESVTTDATGPATISDGGGTVATSVPEADAAADAPVAGLDDVRSAVVQIEAVGTFVDPEFGAQEGAGRGSGFVIDDSNLAVTNNHVVTGAGLLKVWVADEDEPRNARVLGVSECSDLAVVQIDGAPLADLEWSDAPDEPGTEVYVAGFPLGDPEYTLTRGVISKARANGDTNWASVDHTLEHDAAAQPGNSGGPLVTADGRVAGIHYASAVQTNQSQFMAIAADVAAPIVDRLAAGDDVDSVGINGQIVVSEDGEIAGLWVSGVASGSPADEAGILPGDIVTRMEGVTIGRDATMADYCDVLRSHAPDDQLAIEVLRYSTSEVLEGELNGDVLMQSFSFAEEYADDGATPAGQAYDDYVSLTDDSGTIVVSVPSAWTDVNTTPTDLGDGTGSPSIIASTDIASYNAGWDVPGVEFLASPALTEYGSGDLLDLVAPAECTSQGRDAYDDGFFTGQYEAFTDCGGTGTQFYVVSANSNDGSYGVLVAVQVVSDADLEALDTILASFNVTV